MGLIKMNNNKYFSYYCFDLSKETLEQYIESATDEKQHKHNSYLTRRYAIELTTCAIRAIANNEAEFDTKDKEMFNLLISLIEKCGQDDNGVYSQDAHKAIKKICVAYGLAENAITLSDKTKTHVTKTLGNKIRNFLGLGQKSKTTEDIQPKSQKTTNRGFWHTIAITGATVTAGLAMMFAAQCVSDQQNHEDKKTPVKNTVAKQDAKSNANKKWGYSWGQASNKKTARWPIKPFATKQTVRKTIQQNITSTDSVKIVAINNFCDSSLDILIGKKKREALYNKIQNQVNRGIFKIPNGMSLQRIAHAMEMSRIYEGKSIILDALKSDKVLNQAEQEAFAKHIEGIGERGEKLQKRMMKKHKLSSYSKFNKASYAQQKTHIKNLKQLRQLRGR